MAGSADPGAGMELGIAMAQANAAQRRLTEQDGLRRQHRWSVGYLDSRALGAFSFIAAMLSIFLGFLTQMWIGIAAFGTIFFVIAAVALLRARRTRRVRARQLMAFDEMKRRS